MRISPYASPPPAAPTRTRTAGPTARPTRRPSCRYRGRRPSTASTSTTPTTPTSRTPCATSSATSPSTPPPATPAPAPGTTGTSASNGPGRATSSTTTTTPARTRGPSRTATAATTSRAPPHCRQAYGVPAWAASAILAWEKIPAAHRHLSAHPADAPRGALLYYRGGKHGHVAIAIGKKTTASCLSNDYVRHGQIDVAPRDFRRWGLQYLGWSAWTPSGSLQFER